MNQIDHDPNEFKKEHPLWKAVPYAGIAIAVAAGQGRISTHGWDWRDYSAILLLLILLWWFLKPSGRDVLVDDITHNHARNGIAFRFGKALNKVWRGFKR